MLEWRKKIENYVTRPVSMQSCLHYVDSWQTLAQSVLAWAPAEYCNMTFKVMLQGNKQTSSPSFYVLVYFRRKQTSPQAQKTTYPPRQQTSAELIELHPASQPFQVLELKQSRCPPNNRPFPGECRGLRTSVSSLLFVLGRTWASWVSARSAFKHPLTLKGSASCTPRWVITMASLYFAHRKQPLLF